MSALTRFLGDTPLRVLLKLLVVSFVVGVAMSAFGLSPYDLIEQARRFVLGLWAMGFSALDRFAAYLLIGAVVVVPVFLVLRILSYRR